MTTPHDRIRLGPGAEFDLIRRFLAAAPPAAATAGEAIVVGPGDDCAVVRGTIAVSTDVSVEGVHFLREWIGADDIGWRAAAAALSDLAAVAATPVGLLATIAAPPDDVPDFAAQIMAGVAAAAASVGAALLGGDVSASPAAIFVDIVVLGEVSAPVLRTGALPGDELWVTGALGAAAAAVAAWRRGEEPPLAARDAFAHPRPRLAEASWLREHGVLHAMLDLSDGLAGDAAHLAAAGGVGIVLDPAGVPVAAVALDVMGARDQALELALAGGEDYELCFAAPAGAVPPLAAAFEGAFGLPLTRVGEVIAGAGVARRELDGSVRPLPRTGYQHFGEGEARP